MDNIERKIIQFVDSRRDDIIRFFRDFVRSDSCTGREQEIAEILYRGMRERGFSDIEIVGRVPERPNVIARYSSGCDGPTFTFNGHMDVIAPQDPETWEHKPFDGDIVDGKIYGRGTVDMKGGTFASFMAALVVSELKLPIRGRLLFTAVCDEERSGPDGVDWLIKSGYIKKEHPDDFGLNCEPTGLFDIDIVTKGVLQVDIEVIGKGAFNARPYLGVSAIEKATAFIDEVKTLRGELANDPKFQHKYLEPRSTQVAMIKGGEAPNLVPDRVLMTAMRRLHPGEDASTGLREYQAVIDKLSAEDPDFKAEIKPDYVYRPPAELPEDLPIYAAIQHAMDLTTGKRLRFIGSEGGTDASNVLAYTGIQMPIFGPGNDRIIGTVDEHLELEDLINAVKIYSLVIYYMMGK